MIKKRISIWVTMLFLITINTALTHGKYYNEWLYKTHARKLWRSACCGHQQYNLTAQQVAAIMNHEKTNWSNNAKQVTINGVKKIMDFVKFRSLMSDFSLDLSTLYLP